MREDDALSSFLALWVVRLRVLGTVRERQRKVLFVALREGLVLIQVADGLVDVTGVVGEYPAHYDYGFVDERAST